MSGQRLTIDRQLGVRVRVARLVADLSRIELAARLGVTVAQVVRFEAGEDRISAEQLTEIAAALQQNISFFFKGWIDAEKPLTDVAGVRAKVSNIELCGPMLVDCTWMARPPEPLREHRAERDPDGVRPGDPGPYLQ